jgi:hypothetical protein
MCGRIMPLTRHHLIPKSTHARYTRLGIRCANVRCCQSIAPIYVYHKARQSVSPLKNQDSARRRFKTIVNYSYSAPHLFAA